MVYPIVEMVVMKRTVVSSKKNEKNFLINLHWIDLCIAYVVPCKEYQCPISKLCIPKTWLCDGTIDCGHEDSSDESGDCSKYL